ncbi:MAG: phosphoribosylpyrophosphate synthetase [Gammaproteobacteria bacterium]
MGFKPYATLTDALEGLRQRGFAATFEPVDGRLKSQQTGRLYAPEVVRVIEHHRYEGASNPDDMSVVYAIEAIDGERGVVVDAFGTYSDPVLGDLLRRARAEEHHGQRKK